VLELPVTYALSSAEGFAPGAVRFLSAICKKNCFGAETDDLYQIKNTAKALLDPGFSPALRAQLETGKSFPAARAAALEDMGLDASVLASPNNILAVEYCKAIYAQDSSLEPVLIHREGSYHDTKADPENPSATAIRAAITAGADWAAYVPEAAAALFQNAPRHSLPAGERAILGKLRTMTDAEFEALPYGSEGLWRKLMHACRQEATLDAILESVKSKRYTRTRLDRMVMCAFLGISQEILETPAPYARVLAFNDTGRSLLSSVKKTALFPNAGEVIDHPYQSLESRCGALYGLFAEETPEPPDAERRRRVNYEKSAKC
jgi:predicted nucleotidyltransferase